MTKRVTRRTFQPPETQIDLASVSDLPLDKPVAVYYRQSTMAQVGNISTFIQTIDMVEELKRRGWRQEQIILIDMDAGVSGTTKIDERAGMRELFSLISSASIGAVACQDEDRLFRDVTQIQVNIFIEACAENHVQVITPSLSYVFHHPTMGSFYKKQFRFKSEVAAEYLQFMKTRLNGAKNRRQREGFWVGGRVPLGYMVDLREDSPSHRRFVVWQPVAEVVHEVFRAFVAHDGHALATIRALRDAGVTFACVHTQKPPEGFYFPVHRGLTTSLPTDTSLNNMVSNPTYIGHWLYKGAITQWNTHEPIVSQDLFFAAFDYVSPYDLNGAPNPRYVQRSTRVHARVDRPVEDRPVTEGMVSLHFDGEDRPAAAIWDTVIKDYAFQVELWRDADVRKRLRAKRVDEVVEFHLLERLAVTFNEGLLTAQLEEQAKRASRAIRSKQTQLDALRKDQATTVTNMTRASLETVYRELEKRYAEIERAIHTAETELMQLQAERQSAEVMLPTLVIFQKSLESYGSATYQDKRRIMKLLVDRVVVTGHTGTGTRVFYVNIYWRDGEVTECEVWNRNIDQWTYADQVFLTRHIEAGSSRETIMARFEGRRWAEVRKLIERYIPDVLLPVPETGSPEWIARTESINEKRLAAKSQKPKVSDNPVRRRSDTDKLQFRTVDIRAFPVSLLATAV